jgi:transposase-like protein
MIEWSPQDKEWTMEDRKRKRLTAKRKFEIYLESKQPGAKIGEIVRREGIHLNDLREIEELVERGAIGALKSRGTGRGQRKRVDPLEHEYVKRELQEKEKALSDLLVEYTLLKKNERLASKEVSGGSGLRLDRNGRRSQKRLRRQNKTD